MYRVADIQKWGSDRDMYTESDFEAQYEKLLEELKELYRDVRVGDVAKIKDSIGDNYVVLVHLATFSGVDWSQVQLAKRTVFHKSTPLDSVALTLAESYRWFFEGRNSVETHFSINTLIGVAEDLGLDFNECVDGAIAEIWDRPGRFIDRVFVKDAPPKEQVKDVHSQEEQQSSTPSLSE